MKQNKEYMKLHANKINEPSTAPTSPNFTSPLVSNFNFQEKMQEKI